VVPEDIRQTVRNNLGGHVNHSMFWELMSASGGAPGEALMAAITESFGTLEDMQLAVNDAGLKRFGSGWTWVVVKDGALHVLSTPNQDNPIMDGLGTPILGIDVWEHAYYLKYQNKRADYLTAWWNVANWAAIEAAFESAATA
jgi:Fe-Mn family superoxide dismutase